MTQPEVLVVGEALIDVVTYPDGRIAESPGGSPANVALSLGRLGTGCRLLTALGSDDRGSRIRRWLGESGVDVGSAVVDRTATSTARLAADGSATYDFDIDWRLTDAGDVSEAGIVHTGSIAAVRKPGAEAVRALLGRARPHALLTYDPNVRPALLDDHERAVHDIEVLVALCDVVKASDEDLRWLYPSRDPLAAAEVWRDSGPSIVVVTRADEGATALTPRHRVSVDGPRVEVADTVGAGDAFMGALIHGMLGEGFSDAGAREALKGIGRSELSRLLSFATSAAAVTVSRPGADPPRITELAPLPFEN
jgi:fructokinase